MKYLFFIGLFSLVVGCSDSSVPVNASTDNNNQVSEAVEPDVQYKILSDENLGTEKRTVKVLLDERISEQQLEKVAYKIQKMNSEKFKRTFIMYEVKGVDMDMAWATTHFDPDLSVKIWDMQK